MGVPRTTSISYSAKVCIVCSQTSCAVLSHCLTECTYAQESAFLIEKVVATCHQLKNNRINYEFD